LRRSTIIPLFLAIVLGLPPAAFAQNGDDGEVSELSGHILDQSGQPVAGASVLAYHLSTEEVFTSDPTSAKGEYEIGGLPYGYFDLAIKTPDGLYVTTQVINVSPSSKLVLSLTLTPYAAGDGSEGRSFPGTDEEPVGLAQLKEKPKGTAFLKSGKGIGLIAGGSAVVLLLVASGGSSKKNEVSKSGP
jgi:hypothetical protein